MLFDNNVVLSTHNNVTTSPDGRYLALRLQTCMSPSGSGNIGDQRMSIAVFDTETGKEVRTVRVSGLVLRHCLTNDSLVVETSQGFHPAGTATLNVFSLNNTQAEPGIFRTDQWLKGTTADSILLAPQDNSYKEHLPYVLTRLGTSGQDLGTVEGVSAIHPGGWVERFKDPEAAARAIVTDRTEPHTLPAELFNLDSGTSLDITGFSVFDDPTPAGPGILLLTSTTTGGQGEKDHQHGALLASRRRRRHGTAHRQHDPAQENRQWFCLSKHPDGRGEQFLIRIEERNGDGIVPVAQHPKRLAHRTRFDR